jgi:hypothetical protein
MSERKKDPLFGAAVLKVSLELKGMLNTAADQEGYNEILDGVVSDLGLTHDDLDRYITEHRVEIEKICREKGLA